MLCSAEDERRWGVYGVKLGYTKTVRNKTEIGFAPQRDKDTCNTDAGKDKKEQMKAIATIIQLLESRHYCPLNE
jgi:hypothetical protein